VSKIFKFVDVTIKMFEGACAGHAKGAALVCKYLCARLLAGDQVGGLLGIAAQQYGINQEFADWAATPKRKDTTFDAWLKTTSLPMAFASNARRLAGAEDDVITQVMVSGKALNNSLLTAFGVPTLRVKGVKAGATLPVAAVVTTPAAADRPVSATDTIGDALLVVQGLRASAPKWTSSQALMTQVDALITQLRLMMMKSKVEA